LKLLIRSYSVEENFRSVKGIIITTIIIIIVIIIIIDQWVWVR